VQEFVEKVLTDAVGQKASDVHFTVGLPPQLRVEGLWRSHGEEPMTPSLCAGIVRELVGADRMAAFLDNKDLDVSYSIQGVGRFRVNSFFQRGSMGAAIRVMPFRVPDFEELGLPLEIMRSFCNTANGLVLVCGPTGSGKSTTLAAMVGHINRTRKSHIITIEDPIEFLHDHQKSIVDQREIGRDTNGFAEAMRCVLRQSPDIILVGEIRDPETVRTALMLAETGHLVISTIHTGEVTQGLSRLADMFPNEKQAEIRVSLAMALRGMIIQQLLPQQDGTRILAYELLAPNAAVRNLVRSGKFEQVYSLLQTRRDLGMQTMNRSLFDLWQNGDLSREVILARSPRPLELENMLSGGASGR